MSLTPRDAYDENDKIVRVNKTFGLWARFEPELIRRIERMVRPQVLAYPEVEASVLVADIV